MEDSNSMANSIEARVPFLDHKFVEYCFSHNTEEFMKNGENKAMLRQAMKKILPSSVLSRKSKSGRPGNDNFLMYNVLNHEMSNILSSKEFKDLDFFNKNILSVYNNDQKSNNQERGPVWFRIYCFYKWWILNFR